MLGRRLIVGMFIAVLGLGGMHVSRTLLQPVIGIDVVPPIIRLHIIPHSDGVKDQDVKLLVRDDVLSYLQQQEAVAAQTTVEGAVMALNQILPELKEVAAERLARSGMAHEVKVDLSVVTYDQRQSMSAALPAGNYLALRVIIGAGKGSNFWCIVFPGLCFVPEPALAQPAAASQGNVAHAAAPPAALKEKSGMVGAAPPEEAARHNEFDPDPKASETAEKQMPEPATKVQWRWALWDRLFGN